MKLEPTPTHSHSLPFRLRTYPCWLKRIVAPLLLGAMLLTTTGCSMIMGFFGPTEVMADSADTESVRILLPTPVGEGASTRSTIAPNPTPFIMRPSRTTIEESTSEEVNSEFVVSSNEADIQPTITRVLIAGDSVNIRNAPGLDTVVLTTVPRATEYDYAGETAAGDWVQICCFENQLAWVYRELVEIETVTIAREASDGPSTNAPSIPASPQSAVGQTTNRQATLPRTIIRDNQESSDYASAEHGYSLTLPPSWLPIVDTRGLVADSLAYIDQENPDLADLMEQQLNQMGEIPVSLIAFDLAPEAMATEFATNVNVIKQPVPAGFPLSYLVQFSADQLKQVLGLSQSATSTEATLPAGDAVILDYELNSQAVARQYYLLHDQALFVVTFSTAASISQSNIATFDEIMQTFRFN